MKWLFKLAPIFFIFQSPLFSQASQHACVVKENIMSPTNKNFDCHTSSLIEVKPGTLYAVWKGGPGKGRSNIDIKKNVGIWASFFQNDSWSPPQEIVKTPHSVCWNPVLAKDVDGKLTLFYRVGLDPRHTISLFKTSLDGGVSWSEEKMLPAGIVGPTKSKPLFENGNMIVGSSTEVGAPEDEFKGTACWIEILSKNNQWMKYGPLEIPEKQFGCIEPTLFLTEEGTLKMLCRDRSNRIGLEGWIWTASSKDGGKTWSEMTKTTLPNPDSGLETLTLNSKKVLLFYNHSHKYRQPLTVALSEDGGLNWKPLFNLDNETSEFPSATMDSKGIVHVIYAWTPKGKTQRLIKHVAIDPNKF